VAAPHDDQLDLLRVIGDPEGPSDGLDSSDVSRRLGWTDDVTASSLAEARARLLIWGVRVGGTPGPRFEGLELTVQGRRLLLAADAVPTVESSPNGPPPVLGTATP